MNRFVHFVQYHNAVPLAIGIVVMGAGATFAATNPEAIYSQTQTPISVDNTYIADKDLTTYTPRVQITGVTEDSDFYYVTYTLSTIDVQDDVWQDGSRDEVMKVSKPDLGPYRDLGVYVTGQLKQIIGREGARLSATQEEARKNISQKVVAVAYGGLVGKFLDDKTETLPGYTPVVVPPPPVVVVAGTVDGQSTGGTSSSSGSSSSGGSSSKIGLQLLGNNPARISVGTSYIDLGAVLIDPFNTNVGVYAFLDGKETSSPNIDPSTTTSYAIEYRATDPSGSTIVVRRIVLVGDVPDPGGEISVAGNVNPPAPTPAPTPTPTPTPTPESNEPSSEPTD